MARNYEKNFSQLNRLWISRMVTGKHEKQSKVRPQHSLRTASSMKHSLSSIKEEMEYCLKQSQVPCYTDGKVYDYYHRITQLELKYKATLRKLRKCDHVTKEGTSPSLPYKQKANRCVPAQLHKIHTPVLDKPENRIVTEQPTVTQCEAEFMDRPLEFQALKRVEMQETKEPKKDIIHPLGIDYSSSDEETQQ